jgi:uncharacterized membrane protein YcaP (DUF421 family)
MPPSLPRPPQLRREIKISREQLAGLAALAAVITAGAVDDASAVLASVGRIAAVYFFLTLAFRLLGKRELSSLSPLELITLMLIPEIASRTVTDHEPVLDSLVGISVLLAIVFIVSLLSNRFKAVEALVDPPPRVLVVDGELCRDALLTERITPEELYAEMHKHGIHDVSNVRWAILESGGDISFIPKHGELPVDMPEHRRVS